MRHPTVQVPNIGPMDHAWDLLGEWATEFELPETESPVHGKVTFRSWTDAELNLDPIEAAIAGIPSTVPLERASEIHLTDAGGGALQWVLHAPSTNWSLQATMWPGSLHLFVSDADDDEEQLYRARAVRTQDYYLRKNADADRDSASGVSLDEELTGMLTYQRAYEGASRLLTALDQNLDTLINRTGIAGRA